MLVKLSTLLTALVKMDYELGHRAECCWTRLLIFILLICNYNVLLNFFKFTNIFILI